MVIAAYRKWGINAFARLIGDFALALWDPNEHCLLLVSDSLGLRPLYYHLTTNFALWSSRARSILEVAGPPLEFNDNYIASFLVNGSPASSPFKSVGAVPGGHALVVGRKGVKLNRYWHPDPQREIRYNSDAEYEAHFRELFQEAVACRMQADGPVYAELSGGVDSSSIVLMGDHLLASGRTTSSDLRTVSYVFDGSITSDERRYIQIVEERRGRPGVHIREEDHPILSPPPEGFQPDLPSSQLCFLARYDHLANTMEDAGGRVLLSGVGGDQMFWSQPPAGLPLADLAARGRLIELLRASYRWSRCLRQPLLKLICQGAFLPLLPRVVKARAEIFNPLGEWFNAAFSKRMKLREWRLGSPDDLGFRIPSTSQQYSMIRQTLRMYALELRPSRGCIDVRYPYLDRRLVEFTLAIPLEQKVRPGETRSIVRRSLRDVMPEAIRERKSKNGPAEALYRALVREWPWLSQLLVEPRVSAYGFVNKEAFATALRRARHGLATNTVQLLKTISLELWLRSFDDQHARNRVESYVNPPPSVRLFPGKGEPDVQQHHLRSA
jgi:asparagine synthase (glutamine-hydrolysing)